MSKPYLIVGAGIAGTVLARTLELQGEEVFVFNKANPNAASFVAAGLSNPLVPKRLTHCWRAEDFLQQSLHFFEEFQQYLGVNAVQKVLFKKRLSDPEALQWIQTARKESELPILSKEVEESVLIPGFMEAHHLGTVLNCYLLDMALLCTAYHDKLREKKRFFEEEFKGQKEGIVIRAEGYQDIPGMRPTKGQALIIESEALKLAFVFKKNIAIIPLGEQRFWVGATYEWEFENDQPDADGLEFLLEKLDEIVNVPYKIIEHLSGIRPTTIDRRPLLGIHPLHKEQYIFNGMGTRGAMQSPTLAKELIAYIQRGTALHPEVDSKRFV